MIDLSIGVNIKEGSRANPVIIDNKQARVNSLFWPGSVRLFGIEVAIRSPVSATDSSHQASLR